MTELAFHFNVADKLNYVCRLLRKAVSADAKVLVVAGEADLQRLDLDLWTFAETEFLSHSWGSDSAVARQRAQVILSPAVVPMVERTDVLVNLAESVPDGFAQFARLIEVVGEDAMERSAARQRWKLYTQSGYTIQSHDAAPRTPSYARS